MALRNFTVTGVMPIRDAQTRESVMTGGVVTLDDAPVPRAGHKPLAATHIDSLVASGCIAPFAEPAVEEPIVEPKKATKAEA